MEQKVAVVRDGHAEQVITRLLVPGDVILLLGGSAVPADVDWLEGDVLQVDTAALTGEAQPRKYPSEIYGKRILAGSTIQAGEAYCLVRQTGGHTEIGGSQEAIMHDKAASHKSLFESRVLTIVSFIIGISLVIVLTILLVQGIARKKFRSGSSARNLITTIASILVASVPVALPLVLQVTMALGAGSMATEHNAVVTSLSALQDISSMTILCSDKTGTLTTARISIHNESIWCSSLTSFTARDVTFFARLASNVDKEDDPVDRCCIEHFNRNATEAMRVELQRYKLIRYVGFNPVYKRVLWIYSHPDHGVVTIAKGLPNKIVDTSDGGVDDAEDQWKVENHEVLLGEVNAISEHLSAVGYKTMAVAVKMGDSMNQPWQLVGVAPMLDPPRHDSAKTIKLLNDAGIQVKMITGDHENIAKETARILGMGTNIMKGEELHQDSSDLNELIFKADGFSQVLPKDKRKVVEVLHNHYSAIVGMTGDGVNDAPALSAAQCGVAVQGATDAAKNAAAIILTSPGLSAIFGAVIESRRIFRKLRSYIVYRFASTIQIVTSLTLLIFISNCEVNSLLIILLALFNDLTLLPIAYDRQQASAQPEHPSIRKILVLACILGVTQSAFTMLWAYTSYRTNFFNSDLNISGGGSASCSITAQTAVWVELGISSELLIFSTRTPKLIWNSLRPSVWLIFSVFSGCLIISIFAVTIPAFGTLYVTDVLIIWLYVLITMVVVDLMKLLILTFMGETFEEIAVSSVEDVGSEPEPEMESKPEIITPKQPPSRGPSLLRPADEFDETKWNFPSGDEDIESVRPYSPQDLYVGDAIQMGMRRYSEQLNKCQDAAEEKLLDMDNSRRRSESQLRRVETWIRSPRRQFQPTFDIEDKSGAQKTATAAFRPKPIEEEEKHVISPRSRVISPKTWVTTGVPSRFHPTTSSAILPESRQRSLSGGEVINFERKQSSTIAAIEAKRMHSAPGALRQRYAPPTREERDRYTPAGVVREGRIVVPSTYSNYGSWIDLRRHHISATSLRPHTPATRALTMTNRSRQSLQDRLKARSGSL